MEETTHKWTSASIGISKFARSTVPIKWVWFWCALKFDITGPTQESMMLFTDRFGVWPDFVYNSSIRRLTLNSRIFQALHRDGCGRCTYKNGIWSWRFRLDSRSGWSHDLSLLNRGHAHFFYSLNDVLPPTAVSATRKLCWAHVSLPLPAIRGCVYAVCFLGAANINSLSA